MCAAVEPVRGGGGVPEDVSEGVEQTAEYRHQHQLARMTEEESQ